MKSFPLSPNSYARRATTISTILFSMRWSRFMWVKENVRIRHTSPLRNFIPENEKISAALGTIRKIIMQMRMMLRGGMKIGFIFIFPLCIFASLGILRYSFLICLLSFLCRLSEILQLQVFLW